MNDIAYYVCPDLKTKQNKKTNQQHKNKQTNKQTKKQKQKTKRNKVKVGLPTLPIFEPKGQTNLLFF